MEGKKIFLLMQKYLTLLILIWAGFFVCKNVEAEEITTDIIWIKEQGPIIVNESLLIKPEGSLTIEPGVIVKFASGQYIIISGVLKAKGTKDEPIVFTSTKDDEYGGDSNGDGASTQPQSGDWEYLNFNSASENILDNVIIKYGGGNDSGAIRLYRGGLTISNSTITDNAAGIDNTAGELTINNSSIYNNFANFVGGILVDAAVGNNSREDIIIEAKNNWWGTAEGPCPWRSLIPSGVPPWQINITELCGDKPLVDLGVLYDPWLLSEPVQEQEINPVIIVPGIMGSWEVGGEWKIDPILHTFDNLIKALQYAGYSLNESLFVFPYDWRESNVFTAELLK
ncbi:hypothetical protein KKI23_04230, partial [Patescibacteria group bacterium]|nr:hypothetical protein [Patescibacteria group bacterium]